MRHSSWIIIRRCRADSARRWEHLAGFGKVSNVVSCCIFLGPLSIKAYMCCLPYVPNRVPLLRLMRDRGAVTMSLCRFFGIPEACREEQRAGYSTPPLGSLLLDSSSAVAKALLMATDLAATPHLYPLFLLLAAHPSKFVQDHYTTVPR